MTEFADLYELSEDDRIDLIGRAVTLHKKVTGFIVEDREKMRRYVDKLKLRYPDAVVSAVMRDVPIKGCITVKMSPKDAVGRPFSGTTPP